MITVLAVLCLMAAILVVWAAWIEPRRIVIKRHEMPLDHLEQPMTAVIVGDIQPNRFHWPTERLAELFGRLSEAEAPDLVLWLGDYYNAHTDKTKLLLDAAPRLRRQVDRHLLSMREIADAMAFLRGRLASVAVLGNHDWAWSGTETARELARVDITVLMDDILSLEDPETGAAVQILGYEDLSSGRMPAFAALHARLAPHVATLSLSHSPDAFPDSQGGAPLMISGHTHGGQVRLPFLGPILLPITHQRFDRGWFVDGARHLFVTSGMGTSLPPLRFLVPPEVVILRLVPARKKENEHG